MSKKSILLHDNLHINFMYQSFPVGCAWILFGRVDDDRYSIFAIAISICVGGSGMTITSTSLIANMIGGNSGIRRIDTVGPL